MAKKFSFVAENVTPVSQNNRSTALINRLQNDLTYWHNLKYPTNILPKTPRILGDLEAKVFYIHAVNDYKDADNISKPLWDSLNNHAYDDDYQIKYLETLKIHKNTRDILELDLTNIDSEDFTRIVDFILNPANTVKRILYVCVSDFGSKKVRL
jgi:hypothetical protein